MTDRIESFSGMLRAALGERVAAADGFVEMLADDAVMEFPYAPPGFPARVEGKAAIADYLTALGRRLSFDTLSLAAVHPTVDPAVTIIEFTAAGRAVDTGRAYDQRYVSVVRTAAGRIVLYRDYWNPLAILSALKGDAVDDAITVTGVVEG